MTEEQKTDKVAMAAVIVTGVVSMVCILACAGVVVAFIYNAPW